MVDDPFIWPSLRTRATRRSQKFSTLCRRDGQQVLTEVAKVTGRSGDRGELWLAHIVTMSCTKQIWRGTR
jgi:hypothetical protein